MLLRKGIRGTKITELQQALKDRGYSLDIDGDFGPQTEAVVRQYQEDEGLVVDGIVGPLTWSRLVGTDLYPPQRVVPINLDQFCVLTALEGRRIKEVALSILYGAFRANCREVGGNNRGPIVRASMEGHEGREWPWCAGFVTKGIEIAARILGKPNPFIRTFSSSAIHRWAEKKGLIIPRSRVESGDVFLVRGGSTGYRHTGMVLSVTPEYVETAEGNVGARGGRGDRVMNLRRRAVLEYIRVPD